jgi:hypothetical protein
VRDREAILLQLAELRRLREGYKAQGKQHFVSFIDQMLAEAEAELRQHDGTAASSTGTKS